MKVERHQRLPQSHYLFFEALQASRVREHSNHKQMRCALVSKPLFRMRELSQLMSDHILSHKNRYIVPTIVHQEPDTKNTIEVLIPDNKEQDNLPNKVGKDRTGPRLSLYLFAVDQSIA